MTAKYAEPIDRIIANSIVSETHEYNGSRCWEWIGKSVTNRAGMRYGRITVRENGKHKSMLVHRFVLKYVKGRRLTCVTVGMHLCNYSLCCHPDHLAGGSQSTNMKQCVAEGRHNSAVSA